MRDHNGGEDTTPPMQTPITSPLVITSAGRLREDIDRPHARSIASFSGNGVSKRHELESLGVALDYESLSP